MRQVTGLLLSNLCKDMVKKSIWKFVDIFPNQVLNFLNTSTEYGKILSLADYTKASKEVQSLFYRNVIVERL